MQLYDSTVQMKSGANERADTEQTLLPIFLRTAKVCQRSFTAWRKVYFHSEDTSGWPKL